MNATVDGDGGLSDCPKMREGGVIESFATPVDSEKRDLSRVMSSVETNFWLSLKMGNFVPSGTLPKCLFYSAGGHKKRSK
jgi:hypothetical protein